MPYKDPETRAAYHRAWKRRHRHRYKKKEATYSRAYNANRRAKIYGSPGRITQEDVLAVLAVGHCFYCGATASRGAFTDLGIDHQVPLHAGGPNTLDNLVACCHSCNASKYRGDAPGRWSRTVEACVDCGTTERPHLARARCGPCYRRAARAQRHHREATHDAGR